MTDALNRTTSYEYDKLGRRTKRKLPGNQSETYNYNLTGTLTSRVDFNGRTTTFAYDAMNRLLTKTPDASFGAPAISYSYNLLGQRLTMSDVSGTTNYSYDLRNRLSSKATPQGTLSYTYDGGSNLKTVRSNNTNGVSVDYSYDVLNRLSTVIDNNQPAANQTTNYSYDDVGNLSNFTTPNGVTHSYTYNSLNRLTNVGVSKTTTTLASYAYTLGAAGNRTAVTEANGRTVNYSYDNLYRLTNETIANATNPNPNGAIAYTYDAVGNRLSRTSTVAGVPTVASQTVDANDRLTSDGYDANGNTTASSGNGYVYDFENRLIKVNAGTANEISISYDGDGNRVSKTVAGVTTKFLVDTNNLTGYAQVVEEMQGSLKSGHIM